MKNGILHIGKYLLGLGLLAMLLVPAVLEQLTGFDDVKLKGHHVPKPAPELTWKNWLSEEYQTTADAYIQENFGFRNSLVRLHNQIDWSLFQRTRANNVCVGKEGYLYDTTYISSYLGHDLKELDELSAISRRLAKVRDTLKNHNIDLCVVFAPGKASFFPEYIPEQFHPEIKTRSNYDEFLDLFARDSLDFVDMDLWFRKLKGKVPYPLYPQCGVHWSYYGMWLAADSLINKVELVRNVRLPELVADTIYESAKNLKGDYDIGASMNLLWDAETYPMAYPRERFVKDDSMDACKVLVVSDSYYYGMVNKGLSFHAFDAGEFWYYGKEIIQKRKDGIKNVSELNIWEDVKRYEMVIILATVGNLKQFPFKFSQRILAPWSDEHFEQVVQDYIKSIKGTESWLRKVEAKAEKQGISVERMLRLDAVFMARGKMGKELKNKAKRGLAN